MLEAGLLLRENFKFILLILALIVVVAGGGAWFMGQFSGPRTEEIGRVIRFGAYDDHEGARLVVIVRTAGGQVLQLHADAASLSRCHSGSPIRLIRRGSVLTVSALGCWNLPEPQSTANLSSP